MDDGVVLVTYSRPYPTRVVQGVYPYDVYETKHQQLTEQGYRLLSALPAGTVIDEDETLIVVFASWEIDIID